MTLPYTLQEALKESDEPIKHYLLSLAALFIQFSENDLMVLECESREDRLPKAA